MVNHFRLLLLNFDLDFPESRLLSDVQSLPALFIKDIGEFVEYPLLGFGECDISSQSPQSSLLIGRQLPLEEMSHCGYFYRFIKHNLLRF